MAAVGIVLPQMFWVADLASHALGHPLTGVTDYMFDDTFSLLLRSLSLFHARLRPPGADGLDRPRLGAAGGVLLHDCPWASYVPLFHQAARPRTSNGKLQFLAEWANGTEFKVKTHAEPTQFQEKRRLLQTHPSGEFAAGIADDG